MDLLFMSTVKKRVREKNTTIIHADEKIIVKMFELWKYNMLSSSTARMYIILYIHTEKPRDIDYVLNK